MFNKTWLFLVFMHFSVMHHNSKPLFLSHDLHPLAALSSSHLIYVPKYAGFFTHHLHT